MSYDKPRIGLMDSTMDVMMKMTGGNPGALNVCMQILKDGAKIDPDGFMGGLGAILAMDTHDIYESDIWVLYKDVCGSNLVSMLAFLRAVQLGITDEFELTSAIKSHKIDADRLNELVAAVKERLPNFDKELQAA